MKYRSVGEVIDKLKECKTKHDRVLTLQQNDSMALRGILKMNYDMSLNLSLPYGVPPYKKSDKPDNFADATLLTSAKSWYVFSKELSPNLQQAKREFLFIQLLEALDNKEAQILLDAKDRKLKLGLTKKVLNDAFPGIISGDLAKIQDDVEEEQEVSQETKEESDVVTEKKAETPKVVANKKGRGRPKKTK